MIRRQEEPEADEFISRCLSLEVAANARDDTGKRLAANTGGEQAAELSAAEEN